MNNSIDNISSNVMPDRSPAEGEQLYAEAVQVNSESAAVQQGSVQPQEAAPEAVEVAAPAEAAGIEEPADVAGAAGTAGAVTENAETMGVGSVTENAGMAGAGAAGTAGVSGTGQAPQQSDQMPYTGQQMYQVGDQWQIGEPQPGQQYTQGQGAAQQGSYGTGADQWQTVKEQPPYGASQYGQNSSNGAWQQNGAAQYQNRNQNSGQWQQGAGQYQSQYNGNPNYTYNQNNMGSQPQQYTTQQAPAHGKAVASLILGIVGTVCCIIGVCGVVGLILAIMAKKEGNREGIRTVGFVLSIIASALWVIFMIMMIAGMASDPYYYY